MTLYLVRHGAAGTAAVDSDRPLTDIGRREIEALRTELAGRAVKPDRILHSRYRRARETAELLAPVCESVPQEHSAMSPEDDPDVFIAELGSLGGATLIVSHLPYLPHLCEELLENPSPLPVFGTGSTARLDPVGESSGRRGWRLVWQIDGRALLR